jgi:TatD DNase family protein
MSYADVLKKNIEDQPSVITHSTGPSSAPKQEKQNPLFIPQTSRKRIERERTENSYTGTRRERQEPYHLIDIGVNLTSKDLLPRSRRILQESVKRNCRVIVSISRSVKDSERVIRLVRELNAESAGEYKLYCTIGVHPHEASRVLREKSNWLDELDSLIDKNRDVVVAIGECGLDYRRMFSTKADQKTVLIGQMELAKKNNLPLYFHEREANEDFLAEVDSFLKDNEDYTLRGVVHCFTGNTELAKKYLERGLYLGITGWVCDQMRAQDLKSTLKDLGVSLLPRILTETDAPYLTPKDLPNRPLHNGPQYIPHIAKVIATVMEVDKGELCRAVIRNASALFNI